tara:strand:+ start:165 stop:611 length:447 start_codon:yes stop_codon:yes gene_type:complete
VTDSCIDAFDGALVPQEKKKKQSKFAPNPIALIVARCERLYKRQLDGLTVRQLVLDHASKEGISPATAWKDWDQVKTWNDEDWMKDRETMIARIQGMRIKLFDRAIRKGQLQTAAMLLDSIGKVVGESVETIHVNAPELAIRVETKKD